MRRSDSANEPLYVALEAAFASMVPMWRDLGVVPDGEEPKPWRTVLCDATGVSDGVAGLICEYLPVPFRRSCKLQVVVKAQAYLMPPGAAYAGKWHLEGLTENIVAVGAYYLEADPALQGGTIRFRNLNTPAHDNINLVSTVEVQTREGCALAWANTLPHRVRRLHHPAQAARPGGNAEAAAPLARRTFINFFVVDPTRPLPTLATCPAHPGDQWRDDGEGKVFRDRLRGVMGKTAGGWGFSGYGNCGLYIANFKQRTVDFNDSERFHRTDSDREANRRYYAQDTWEP